MEPRFLHPSSYQATVPHTLSTGDGTKTVHARVSDVAGNVSPVVTATIRMRKWRMVTGGCVHTVAIRTDGTFGPGDTTHDGQLGVGTTTNRNSPVQVGTGFAQVAAGD